MPSMPLFFVVLTLSLGSACTFHHDIRTMPRDPGLIVTTQRGEKLEVHPQGERWVTATGRIVELDEIQKAERQNHRRGALEGLGWGAGAGALIGAAAGRSADRNCRSDVCLTGPIDFLLGNAIGGLVGLMIGGAVGAKDVYTRPVPQLQVAPTTDGMSAQLSWQL